MTLEESVAIANRIIDDFRKRDDFMAAGKRNDHAVDWCIAHYVLGQDPLEEFYTEAYIRDMSEDDIDLCVEHIERIMPYLPVWGFPGKESDALIYCIGSWF